MSGRPPQIFNIPSGIPFARSLCAGIVQRFDTGAFGLADTLVLVPTRRSARALRDSFAEFISGAALLPRIVALADVEGDPDDSDLPDNPESLPVIPAVRRRLLMA